ncbi:hypothetical protein BDK51DRAFT_39362 [Blyttiomyces helicus]|uniref:RBR-type E3 ubiquitin transferase n=1 Tax=Blyttiomyces helicus TaxID=388810 RepID=A0A4P9W8I1_9FUNG|nr:hypothetical protein BDK51DRAFT_39362 [Blyttiomyces helicus]|eukprot:RKO87110.1 hypothetical protein BDK51DRAFT_39362 [Blyttiomyces helicus]
MDVGVDAYPILLALDLYRELLQKPLFRRPFAFSRAPGVNQISLECQFATEHEDETLDELEVMKTEEEVEDEEEMDEVYSVGEETDEDDEDYDDSDNYEDDEAYEEVFDVHTTADIIAFQNREVSHVAGILGAVPQHAASLLHHFDWNKEKLIESYLDDPEKIAKSAGVIIDSAELPRLLVLPNFECDVCGSDNENLESLALACGHHFCQQYWKAYLGHKIEAEGESRRIRCPASGCNIVVDQKTVELVVEKAIFENNRRYEKLLVRTSIDQNPHMRWCPAPDCEHAIECRVPSTSLRTVVPTVTCCARIASASAAASLTTSHRPARSLSSGRKIRPTLWKHSPTSSQSLPPPTRKRPRSTGAGPTRGSAPRADLQSRRPADLTR